MTEPTLEISINGESQSVPAATTIAELLERLHVDRRHVAVERNRKLVIKDDYASVVVEAGDALEIVTFVGGG